MTRRLALFLHASAWACAVASTAIAAPPIPNPAASPRSSTQISSAELALRFEKALRAGPSIAGCRTDYEVVAKKACAREDEVIRLGKQTYIRDDTRFVGIVGKQIDEIESAASYRYLPILIASLSRDVRFLPSLEKLAEKETRLRIRSPYGKLAVQRMKANACEAQFSKTARFREICTDEDSDFNRIRLTKGIK